MALATNPLQWLVAIAVFAAGAAYGASMPEIDSSVLVFGPSDYVVNGGQSRCQKMVENAKAYQQSRLMFVPTAFWVDLNYRTLRSVNSQSNVSYYCMERTNGNGSTPTICEEATQAQISTFTSSMAACFKSAVDSGFDIAISPHLDDGLGLGGWRNGLLFDPLQKYGTHSYADFFLYPLADALAQSISADTKVLFAMQGEMSATVMYFPQSYIELLDLLKQRVLANKPSNYNAANIQVGVSTNFNKLCGCVLQDLVDTYQYVAQFPAAFEPLKGQFNLSAISDLYNKTDFIGISSYPSLTPNFSLPQLEAATEQFDFEIGQFGVDLKDLVVSKKGIATGRLLQGKPLYWNEYGVGGGSNQNGQVKATTAEEAAAYPFFGVFGIYSRANDPWVLYDLSQPSPVRDYLRYFYNQTIAYAQQTGKNPDFKYIVSGIFIWNSASWDVQAVYPESTSQEGSYRDPVLVPLINAHNVQAAASTGETTNAPAPVTNVGSTVGGGGAAVAAPPTRSASSSQQPSATRGNTPGVLGSASSFNAAG